eukprot:78532_1
MLSFLSRFRSNKSKKENVSDVTDTNGSNPENHETDPVDSKPQGQEQEPTSVTKEPPSQSTSPKPKKKKKKKKKKSDVNTPKGKGNKNKNKSKKPNTSHPKPKKNAKKSTKSAHAKKSKTTNQKQPKTHSPKTQPKKKKKEKQKIQKAPKVKPKPKAKKQLKDKKSPKASKSKKPHNIRKSTAKKDKSNRHKQQKKEPKHKKQQKDVSNHGKKQKNKSEKSKKEAKDKKQSNDTKPQKKKKQRAPSQIKSSKHTKTKSQAITQRKKNRSSLRLQNKKPKTETKSMTNKTKAKDNRKKKSKDTKQAPKTAAATKSKESAKKKKKQKERRNSHRQKDIETAKRRLSKRLSIKELTTSTPSNDTESSPISDDNDDIWSDYMRKFCHEPQTASELHTFAKTDSRYTVLNYKECRIIFDEYMASNDGEIHKDLMDKTKEDRDQIYKTRDIKLAKKRRSQIMTFKQINVSDLKDRECGDDGRLMVDKLDLKPRRSILTKDSSWMTHESEDKSSVELIKENIKAQKETYLASLAGVHSLEKKKEIGKLFEKHMEHAKVNNITSNGEVEDDGGANTAKLFDRLKDEDKAMENAVSIVKDLGFFKYIKDDDVYGKIYIKKGQMGMDEEEEQEAVEDGNDFDLFDMNNIDILSKFEGSKREVLSNVICKAIVSMPQIEIVEMCNADISDDFIELLVGYMKQYYRKCKQPRISILSMQSNPISDRGMVSLIELVEMNHGVLSTIKLQNNRKDISTAVCQQMCESLEQNEFIIKFEFLFRHYQWRDFRDRVVKRNAEKARIQRLELQKSMSI